MLFRQIVIYYYAFYKMKIRESWTVKDIIEKLAKHTNTNMEEIELFSADTIIRDHFTTPSMKPESYVMSYNIEDGSKLRALRALRLGEVTF